MKEIEKLAEEKYSLQNDKKQAFIEGYKAAINTQGSRWVKASERLPELPDPLPPDTEDERGVLFVNRTHSAAYFWFPSYGQPAKPHVTEDGHWALDQYEWLEEQTNPVDKSPNISQNDTKCEIHVGDTNVTYMTFDPNNHKCTSNGNCIMCVHKTVGHCDLTENGNCFIEEQTKEVGI